jgi:hypothetical protein
MALLRSYMVARISCLKSFNEESISPSERLAGEVLFQPLIIALKCGDGGPLRAEQQTSISKNHCAYPYLLQNNSSVATKWSVGNRKKVFPISILEGSKQALFKSRHCHIAPDLKDDSLRRMADDQSFQESFDNVIKGVILETVNNFR